MVFRPIWVEGYGRQKSISRRCLANRILNW
jgi:hypothetical protein